MQKLLRPPATSTGGKQDLTESGLDCEWVYNPHQNGLGGYEPVYGIVARSW